MDKNSNWNSKMNKVDQELSTRNQQPQKEVELNPVSIILDMIDGPDTPVQSKGNNKPQITNSQSMRDRFSGQKDFSLKSEIEKRNPGYNSGYDNYDAGRR